MKYTLLTAAALATVAITAPAPEKALSLRGLGLGGGDNKATVNGNILTIVLDLETIVDDLSGNANNVKVPTNSKAKAKRGHNQGAQLVKTLKGLLGGINGHTNTIDATLLRIGSGGITRAAGTKQCLDLLQTITGLLDEVVDELTGFPSIGGGDYDDKVLDILDPLVSGLSETVSKVARTLGGGRRPVGGDSLTPVTSSLTNLLQCLLDVDPSLRTGIQGLLSSVLGGVGTGPGTGPGTIPGNGASPGIGSLGHVLGKALSPFGNLLSSIDLEVDVEVGGKGSAGGNTGGHGSSGSGNESPVYSVPT